MIKLFVTGDNHFGKKYDRYKEIKEILIKSRFDALEDMVKRAENEACDLLVVTGDLFDNINTIKIKDVKNVAQILAKFSGNVIILPGNHDYYTGEEKVWKDFEDAISKLEHNITLIKEFKPYEFESGEENVVIYPAFCASKHSEKNNLEWIKNAEINKENVINIGVAHGAIKGITPDMKEEYFLMTEEELLAIPVDAWLIGHTHIPYPDALKEDKDTKGYRIFNAGTHEQTDLHNNTQGNAFIISIDKKEGKSEVLARKFVSGKIRYYDLDIKVSPDKDNSLTEQINKTIQELDKKSVIRLKINGLVKPVEYENKEKIYKELLKDFLSYEISDDELSEEITIEKIRDEYAQTSFAAKFMEELIDNPVELQMVYQLLQNCKE